MKNNEIDFLKGKSEEIRNKKRRSRLIKTFSFAMIILYLIVTGATFGMYYLKKNNINAVDAQISSITDEISDMQTKETKQILLANKLETIAPLLDSKKEHKLLIGTVFEIVPENVSVSNFRITEGNVLEFSISSQDFEAIKQFFFNLKLEKYPLTIEEAKIENFTFNKENNYSMGIKLKVNQLERNNED